MNRQSGSRLLSLDIVRGLTIAGMILVNSPGNGTAYAPLEHAEWNGWTPTDLVFPFFVFILGVSLVFSLSKRRQAGDGDKQLLSQILKRSSVIFGLGLLLNGFPYNHLEAIRIPGVLQRIALCYFFASVFFLRLSPRKLIGATVLLLLGYWGLMALVPVPGYGAGDWSKAGNLAAYIDRIIFHGHMYTPDYDPEGILSTLPAMATALIGVLTGIWLLKEREDRKKVLGMLTAGVIGMALGQLWNRYFPINKALWTSSYVCFTAGMALALLAAAYWWIDVKGHRWGAKFFEVFGTNGIVAYVAPLFFLKIQNRIPMPNADGSAGNVRLFFTRHVFESWTTPRNASLFYAIAHVLLWYAILSALHKRRIFIKV